MALLWRGKPGPVNRWRRMGLLLALVPIMAVGWVVWAAQSEDAVVYMLPDALSPAVDQLSRRPVVTGRDPEGAWLQVELSFGGVGWVPRDALPAVRTDTLPVVELNLDAVLNAASFWNFATPQARAAFQRGYAGGRRNNSFTTVGDSITANSAFLRPFAYGVYDFGEYAALQTALDYFSPTEANPFAHESVAVGVGWTTTNVLAVARDRADCNGETRLACEYRLSGAAAAFVLLGTNDLNGMTVEEYEANLRQIVEVSLAMDVVPVLHTIPPQRESFGDVRRFNRAVVSVAEAYQVPLVNYWLALQPLPNLGLGQDRVHPSVPPGGGGTTLFTPENLQYGYTVRNLLTLQALDLLLTNTFVLE